MGNRTHAERLTSSSIGARCDMACAQVKSHLSDTDGETGRQHLVSSVVDNYVMYHVIKSSQQTWILDDFQQVRRYSLL